jgi:hypothetical protein
MSIFSARYGFAKEVSNIEIKTHTHHSERVAPKARKIRDPAPEGPLESPQLPQE